VILAWSDAFDAAAPAPVRPVRLPVPIRREWAWEGATGAGVRVAVVDSGVDAGHPAVGRVAGGVALELDERGEVVALEGPHDDLFGHGTACAGIVRSLAPDVELHSVRVLGPNLTGKGAVFAAGIRWCLDQGIQVANLSLSSRSAALKETFHDLADESAFRGMLLVCAANNVVAPSYPSTFASVVSVAATADTDPERFLANPSPPVEFGAPGVGVEVAWLGGRTVTTTGNSFAAAHVTGHLARLLERHPGITPVEARTVLRALAANAVREDERGRPGDGA
jgi:subtilisin